MMKSMARLIISLSFLISVTIAKPSEYLENKNLISRLNILKSYTAYDLDFNYFANGYYNYSDIIAYGAYLNRKYSHLVETETIGYSREGRVIDVVKLTDKSEINRPKKPIIFIDAGIHAREWVAPAVALYILHQLVERYNDNKEMLNNFDWFVIPLLNPDGYVYSTEVDRLWRKNRANTSNIFCLGVDLNRNFDYEFGGKGTSKDPCDETYIGDGPFSEPETRAFKDFALKYKDRTRIYLTLHSFGNFILYPWGFDTLLPDDWRDLDFVGNMAANSLYSLYGTKYTIGPSAELLGAAAGGSDDWMKQYGGAKYSYTIELPGGGDLGFDLPKTELPFVITETWEAIKVFGRLNITL